MVGSSSRAARFMGIPAKPQALSALFQHRAYNPFGEQNSAIRAMMWAKAVSVLSALSEVEVRTSSGFGRGAGQSRNLYCL